MFVSTNCLALMEFITRTRRCPPQVHALAETRQRSPPRPVKFLPLANQRLQAVGEQGTERATLLRGKPPGLAQQIGIKLERAASSTKAWIRHPRPNRDRRPSGRRIAPERTRGPVESSLRPLDSRPGVGRPLADSGAADDRMRGDRVRADAVQRQPSGEGSRTAPS
jgi:hypothetical protein